MVVFVYELGVPSYLHPCLRLLQGALRFVLDAARPWSVILQLQTISKSKRKHQERKGTCLLKNKGTNVTWEITTQWFYLYQSFLLSSLWFIPLSWKGNDSFSIFIQDLEDEFDSCMVEHCLNAVDWAYRMLPFSRFFNVEELIQDIILSLLGELPPIRKVRWL